MSEATPIRTRGAFMIQTIFLGLLLSLVPTLAMAIEDFHGFDDKGASCSLVVTEKDNVKVYTVTFAERTVKLYSERGYYDSLRHTEARVTKAKIFNKIKFGTMTHYADSHEVSFIKTNQEVTGFNLGFKRMSKTNFYEGFGLSADKLFYQQDSVWVRTCRI